MNESKNFWAKLVNRIHRTFIYNRRVGGATGKPAVFSTFPLRKKNYHFVIIFLPWDSRQIISNSREEKESETMTLSVNNSQIPEYYPTMYLDGYTPQQILMAKRRQMLQSQTVDEIKVTSEVKIK